METNDHALKPQLTHRGLMLVGGVVAFALVVIVAVGTWMYLDLRKHERELRQLLNPTAQQFRAQLQQGLKRCLKEPECRKLFPQLVIRKNPKTHQESIVPTSPQRRHGAAPVGAVPRHPRSTSTGPLARRPAPKGPAPKTVPQRPHHHRPDSSQSSTNSTPPPPPPPPPPNQPPVGVAVPILPVGLCSPLVQVNKCPSNPLVP